MDDDFPYPVRGPVAPIVTGEAEASEWKRLDVPPATGEAAEQAASDGWNWPSRSEEHTSELQSLMRISYAVFCLKKKKKYTQQTPIRFMKIEQKNLRPQY